MEFLVEFELEVPPGTPAAEVEQRQHAESVAAAKLAEEGHLAAALERDRCSATEPRPSACTAPTARAELDGLLAALPLADWLHVTVDGARAPSERSRSGRRVRDRAARVPGSRVSAASRPRSASRSTSARPPRAAGASCRSTGGTFTGPELNGTLLPGASADWQIVLPDGTALGDIRYTLQTDGGDVLYVQSRRRAPWQRRGARTLGRGEDVDASEYTFRTSTQFETAAPATRLAQQGRVHQRRRPPARGVIYETYLVG